MILEKSRCFLVFSFFRMEFSWACSIFFYIFFFSLVHLCDDGQKDNHISLIPCFILYSAIVC